LESKILVTGGAGFIGSHLVDELLAKGYSVLVIDNFNSYYSPKRKMLNIMQHIPNKNFDLVVGNIEDFNFMEKVFKSYDITKIIHLAAKAGVRPSIEDPIGYRVANVDGTLNLLELARRNKVQNFIFGSSSSVYGENTKMPFSEEDRVDLQISPYAVTKRTGEMLCKVYSQLYGLNVSCLRFFTVYGPRGRPDMAPYKFIDLLHKGLPISRYGDGTTRRDYTYVSDIVAGIIGALDKNFNFEIFNLGNSEMVVLNDFIRIVGEVVGKEPEIRQCPPQDGDVDVTYADISKARKLLGYNPQVSFKNGMMSFYDWYLKEVDLPKKKAY
jgi:UDP-glucuronate 4-epimerase